MFALCTLDSLEFTGPELDILHDIHKGVRSPTEDTIAKVAESLRKSSTRSLRSVEWSNRDGLLYFRDHIYIPPDSDLCCRIVALCHDTKLAGHPGWFKMLELVARNYWWPNMLRYVSCYVATCDLCLRTKTQR